MKKTFAVMRELSGLVFHAWQVHSKEEIEREKEFAKNYHMHSITFEDKDPRLTEDTFWKQLTKRVESRKQFAK